MQKYFTEQERLMAQMSHALQPYGIATSKAFAVLAQATIMRMNSSTPTTTLTLAEQAAIVLHLLRSPNSAEGAVAESLNRLLPVLGMDEFVTVLETPPTQVSAVDVQTLIASWG